MKNLLLIVLTILCIDSCSQQVQGQSVKTNVNITKERDLVLLPEATVINIPID